MTSLSPSPAQSLLSWYQRQKRDLPWRRTSDPYAIWVSEIMLQQTQVSKVEPFFEAFMKRFPTIEALAEASLDEVLAAWSGLGYYRRARLLHRAAGLLVEQGRFVPTSSEGLLELPGIGPYTAAAIASIAFGEAVPVLDGNVERVAARLWAISEDPKKAPTRRLMTEKLASLLDADNPGDSNQALMELGATVCRPQNPACLLCPLGELCRGRLHPQDFPPPRRRRAVEEVTLQLAIVRRDERLLLFRRSDGASLFAGMWELPTLELRGDPLGPVPAADRLGEIYGGSWRLEEAIGQVRHGITHRSITAYIHRAEVTAGDQVAEGPAAAWVAPADLGSRSATDEGSGKEAYAVSSLVEKALDRLRMAELATGSIAR